MGFLSWYVKVEGEVFIFTRFWGKVRREYFAHEIKKIDVKYDKGGNPKRLEVLFIDGFIILLESNNKRFNYFWKYINKNEIVAPVEKFTVYPRANWMKLYEMAVTLLVLSIFLIVVEVKIPGYDYLVIFVKIGLILGYITVIYSIIKNLWRLEIVGNSIRFKKYFDLAVREYTVSDIADLKLIPQAKRVQAKIELTLNDGLKLSIKIPCPEFNALWNYLDKVYKAVPL